MFLLALRIDDKETLHWIGKEAFAMFEGNLKEVK
jgi:hypothetical protein